ncbi:MAG: hypothetical protein ABIW38_02380 [Ferruginibacter sp.]
MAYFVGTKYKTDDFTPYIFKTEDYGKTWTKITNGISANHFTRCLRADKKRPGLLYAGTEYGMYISYDYGANWKPFQLNLPVVPITDLTIKNNDLVVATQGRAFWIIDDLSMVQAAGNNYTQQNIFVLPVREAVRIGGSQNLNAKNAGINPANGIVVNYYLKNISDSAVTEITILDKNKKLIRKYSTKALATGPIGKIETITGLNQFVWDLNYPPAEKIDGQVLWNNIGTLKAAPGKYYIKINQDKKDSTETEVFVKANPNYKVTQQEYEQQGEFLLTVRDQFNEIQKAIKNIREVRTQINDFVARQGKDSVGEIKTMADSINKSMTKIEEALYQTKAKSGQDVLNYPIRLNDKIAGLYNYAASGNYAPTKQVRDVYDELAKQADFQLDKLKNIFNIEVPKFNQLIREKQLKIIGVKPE